jgi:hypothetical protein
MTAAVTWRHLPLHLPAHLARETDTRSPCAPSVLDGNRPFRAMIVALL